MSDKKKLWEEKSFTSLDLQILYHQTFIQKHFWKTYYFFPIALLTFIFIYLYIYPPDKQESIRGAIRRATVKQLLRPASGDAKTSQSS